MAASSLVPLQINVTSDTVCPFCFLGLRKLEKALSSSPYTSTSSSSASPLFSPRIRFLPFQLDPTLPTSHALSKREMYAKKFGPERTKSMEGMMAKNGEPYGIRFNYDGTVRNTILSHRLMEKAYTSGGWEKQLALLNVLFPHYFEKAGDPGDPSALGEIAIQSGIFKDQDEAKKFFDGSEFEKEVKDGFETARTKGITGVPHFEFEAGDSNQSGVTPIRAEIPGAQEPDTFVAVFKGIAEAYKKANSEGAAESAPGAAIPPGPKC